MVEFPSGLFFAVTDQKLYTDGRVNISTMESEYEGYKAYSIKTNGNVLVFFPVKSESTELYRIINGVSVKVDANYLDGGEQKFLAAKQTLDSQYYLTESSEPSDSGSEQVYRVLLVLIIAVVIAIPILARRKV